jgi:protein PsiE
VTPSDDHPPNIDPLSGTDLDDKSGRIALFGFRIIERALLIVAAAMTIGATGIEIIGVYRAQTITLADILLIFLYTEVMGMIAVFYTGRGSPFVYPIFIAVTALARLIVLQGKDMAPENILFEAAAILLLAIAAVIITRAGKG